MPLMYRRPDAQDHHDPPVALARRDPGGLPLSRTRVLPRDEARSRALMGRWRKSGPRHAGGGHADGTGGGPTPGRSSEAPWAASRAACWSVIAPLRRALRGDGDGWRSSGARGVGQGPQGSPGAVPSTWLGRRDSEARLSSAPLLQNLHGGPSVHPGEALAEGPGRLQRGYPLRYFPVQRRSTWGRCAGQRRPARCGRRHELDVGPVDGCD